MFPTQYSILVWVSCWPRHIWGSSPGLVGELRQEQRQADPKLSRPEDRDPAEGKIEDCGAGAAEG